MPLQQGEEGAGVRADLLETGDGGEQLALSTVNLEYLDVPHIRLDISDISDYRIYRIYPNRIFHCIVRAAVARVR